MFATQRIASLTNVQKAPSFTLTGTNAPDTLLRRTFAGKILKTRAEGRGVAFPNWETYVIITAKTYVTQISFAIRVMNHNQVFLA